MNIRELSAGIAEGKWSSAELTKRCLAAIAENDQAGRKLNTVGEMEANVLFQAEAADREIASSGLKGPLHGVPVLVKDNIDVKGLHTTAGSLALADLIAAEDSAVAEKLKKAGALILGKANLSEFAYFMSRKGMPSGFGSLHGQVVHPYVPGVDPLGSSTGSAVAVAARFVPFAIGTETDGSIMSPAAVNAVTAIKPTVGLVSRRGILPISHWQDTAGPMTTCVEDAAIVLSAIAGPDEADPATLRSRPKDYCSALRTDLHGMRIGIYANSENKKAGRALAEARKILRAAGAVVVSVVPEQLFVNDGPALVYEFKQGLNRYLAEHSSACRTLKDIIDFNRSHPERCLRYGQSRLLQSEGTSGFLIESDYIRHRMKITEEAAALLDGMMDRADLDCLLSAGPWPRGNLAPVSGYPCMSVPAAEPDEANYQPVSFYLTGRAFGEETLIRTAYTLEQALGLTCRPSWAKELL